MIAELTQTWDNQPQSLSSSFNKIFDLFTFGKHLLTIFGLNSIESIKLLFFHDMDHLNITTLLINLIKVIV